MARSFFLTTDLTATVTAAALKAHFDLEATPVRVAEKPRGRSRRIQVWDAAGRGIAVRWDRAGIVAWQMADRFDGPPWSGLAFAEANGIPAV